jgi:pimeloyl-ACP methyl ester carboxylesterase
VVELEDGRGLGFAEWGPQEGQVVLWFHGTPGGCRQVPPDAPDLARRHGLRLIGIERPGTGLSSKHRYERVIDWAIDVEGFADAHGIDEFAVIGLSGGGPFVLACAAWLPARVVAGAVLGGVGPTRGREAAPGYTRMLPPFEPFLSCVSGAAGEVLSLVIRPLTTTVSGVAFAVYANVISPECDRPVLKRPDMKEAFLFDLTTAAETGVRAAVNDLVLFGRDWGFRLAEIRVPIRFWHGDADKIVPLSHGVHQAALVPDSDLTVVPGGGHFSGYETVEDVFEAVLALWSERVP